MRGGVTKDQLWELVGSKLAYAAGETVCRRNLEEEMRQEWAE
jgi:hypothetical protein